MILLIIKINWWILLDSIYALYLFIIKSWEKSLKKKRLDSLPRGKLNLDFKKIRVFFQNFDRKSFVFCAYSVLKSCSWAHNALIFKENPKNYF